jgi:hypothetical protein
MRGRNNPPMGLASLPARRVAKGREDLGERHADRPRETTDVGILMKVPDPRLYWASFAALDQAIDELLNEPRERS